MIRLEEVSSNLMGITLRKFRHPLEAFRALEEIEFLIRQAAEKLSHTDKVRLMGTLGVAIGIVFGKSVDWYREFVFGDFHTETCNLILKNDQLGGRLTTMDSPDDTVNFRIIGLLSEVG